MTLSPWCPKDEINNARTRAEIAVQNGFNPREGHFDDCSPAQSFLHNSVDELSYDYGSFDCVRTRTFDCSFCGKTFRVEQILSEIDKLQSIFSKMPAISQSKNSPRHQQDEMTPLSDEDSPLPEACEGRESSSVVSFDSTSTSTAKHVHTPPPSDSSPNNNSLLVHFQKFASEVRAEYEEANADNLSKIEKLKEEIELWKERCKAKDYEALLSHDRIVGFEKQILLGQAETSRIAKEKEKLQGKLKAMGYQMEASIEQEVKSLKVMRINLEVEKEASREEVTELQESILNVTAEKDACSKEKNELEEKLKCLEGERDDMSKKMMELKEKNTQFIKSKLTAKTSLLQANPLIVELNALCADWQW